MLYYFNPYVAQLVGSDAATLFSHIQYWVDYNRKKGFNLVNGKHWTYNTNKELQETFIYMSEQKIKTCIEKLKKAGLIETGHYNNDKWKKNTWFTTTEYGDSFVEYQFANKLKTTDRQVENNSTYNNIYNNDIVTDNNTDNNSYNTDESEGQINLFGGVDPVGKEMPNPDHVLNKESLKIIIDAWNNLSYLGLKPVRVVKENTERYKDLKKLVDDDDLGVNAILSTIEKVKISPWLFQTNDTKTWKADFKWFCEYEHFIKVYEDGYVKDGYVPTEPKKETSGYHYREGRE